MSEPPRGLEGPQHQPTDLGQNAVAHPGRAITWLWGRDEDAAVRASLAVPWTARRTLLGAGLTLVPLIALVAVAMLGSAQPAAPLAPAVDRATAVVTLVISSLLEAVFLIAPLYYAITARAEGSSGGLEVLRTLGLRACALWRSLILVLLGWAVIYLASLLYDRLHIQTNADALRQQALRAPYTTLAALLVAILVAPLCEEIFFRGYLLPGLAKTMSVWAAVAVSAVVFGAAHADLGSLVPLVVIGVVVGVLRWRTGSLWPGIALHALNNLNAALYVLSVAHLR